ncbi:MAG: hypothetical protein AB7S41_01375 [Parvibaculaceae bacterium]
MKITLRLEEMRDRLSKLPDSVSSIDEIDECGATLYEAAEDGSLRLDRQTRTSWINDIDRMMEHDKLRSDNERMRLERDCRLVEEAVRNALTKVGVKPSLMDACVALQLREMKFTVDDDGRVFVLGKRGFAEASIATIQWMNEDERAACLREVQHSRPTNGVALFGRGLKA